MPRWTDWGEHPTPQVLWIVYLNPPPSRQTIPITPESSASAPAGQSPPQNISTVNHWTFFSTVDYSTIGWVCLFLNYAVESDSSGAVGLSLRSLWCWGGTYCVVLNTLSVSLHLMNRLQASCSWTFRWFPLLSTIQPPSSILFISLPPSSQLTFLLPD